ncbi:Penicillin-binding protein [Cupriavidus sp. H18C1]|uniref:hypothetical protein n=1 Tax=Cupriavidus sp. H18C1 TaxID=3241601 RepID=UPI003BB98610
MATESRPGTASPDTGNTGAGDAGRQTSAPVGQRNDQGGSQTSGPTPAQSAPDAGGRNGQRDSRSDSRQDSRQDSQRDQREGGSPARESDPAAGRDLPDENGEPPSVKRPGGNPEESEPPVENT